MALYREINFNLGTANDRFGALPTITGSTFSQKEKGMALETGSGKYVQYDRQLLPNGAFSVVVWAKIRPNHIFGTDNAVILPYTINGVGISISYLLSGKSYLRMANNNERYFNYIPDRNWHCYIFTLPGNAITDINTSQFFVDTILQSTTSTNSSNPQQARSNFVSVGGGSGSIISKIKVYDHVLTQKQIEAEQREFVNAKPILKPKRGFMLNNSGDLSSQKNNGLIAAYNMKPIGNTLVDISGSLKNGVITGTPYKTNIGLKFKGGSDKIVLGNIGNVKSIVFRIKLNSTTEKILEGAANSKLIHVSTGILTSTDFANKYLDGVAASTMVANRWYNVTLTSSTDVAFTACTLALNNTTYGNFEIQDLRFYNRVLTTQEIKAYHNSFVKPYITEDFSNAPADGSNVVPNEWVKGTGNYKCVSVTTPDSVVRTIKKNTKYLQCTTAGTIAIPSKQAYGSWEFDWYKGGDNNSVAMFPIINDINFGSSVGYRFVFGSTENIQLAKYVIGTPTPLVQTTASYIINNTWYRIKITRTQLGVFTTYIKGGTFGSNWVLLSTSGGSGANPVTDNTYTTSNYFVLDLDVADRFANLVMYDGIKQ